MRLSEILRGTKIKYDAIQSIEGLTIVPLVCEERFSFDDKYASPYAHNVGTSSYGTLTVYKQPGENKLMLTPPHAGYITKGYAAQDHLISKAALLREHERQVTLNDSRCVESNQGGMIRTDGNNELIIAPLKLREVALNYAGTEGYDKLWDSIGSFNAETGAGNRQQIKDYFSRWNRDLDKFIAHFERLDNCIGFMTLYKDELVAIDKFPSFTYCSQIWDRLVRDSYASLVISDRVKNNNSDTSLPKVEDCRNRSLSKIYDKLIKSRKEHYKMILQEIVDADFSEKADADTPGSTIVESDGYIGQVISDSGVNVMVSIIKKDSFDPDTMRKSRAMRRIARDQQDFKL